MFNIGAARSDKKRDAAIPLPEGVTECRNISYGPYGNESLLDVYYPEGATDTLPTIVSIHGGGYVYGSKEIYRRFGARSSALYAPTEQRDLCPLICLILGNGAARHLPAHLPDSCQGSRATPAGSAA